MKCWNRRVLILFCVIFSTSAFSFSQENGPEFDSWNKSFQDAESTFNSVSQYSCVSMFQDLVQKIGETSSQRALSDAEARIQQKSLDYLAQAYFNNNELDQTKMSLMNLMKLNPGYKLNEDLVSFKLIEFFDELKKENLGVIRVESNPPDAVVKINGKVVGSAGNDVYSFAGTQVVEVSKPGYVSKRQSVQVAPQQTARVSVQLESNPQAMKTYADGFNKLQVLSLEEAKRTLEKSLTELPDYALFRSALAEALWWEGHEEDAQKEARKAFADADSLTEPDRSIVQLRYYLTSYDWKNGLLTAGKLYQSSPQKTEFGLYQAIFQLKSGKNAEAIATIDRLRKQVSGQEMQARLDLLAAEAYRNDPAQKGTLAAKSAEGARSKGLDALAARARIEEGKAALQKNNPEQASTAFEDARKSATSSNDLLVVARAARGQGDTLSLSGNSGDALARYIEASRLLQEIGNKSDRAKVLYRIGKAQSRSGNADEARKNQQEALALSRETQNHHLTGFILCDIGGDLLDRMDRSNARARYEEALEIFRENGDRFGMAMALNGIGDVMIDTKDAKGAKEYYDQVLAMAKESGDQAALAAATRGMGDFHKINGNLEVARSHYEEALSITRQLKDQESIARTLYKLGEVNSELKNLPQARKSFEEAVGIFREIGDKRYLARAEVSLRELTQEQQVSAITLLQAGYELMNAKDYPAAEAKYQEALEISRKIDDKRNQMVALLSLGFILSSRQDDVGSQKLWEEALALSRELKDKQNESLALWNLSVAAFNMGDRATAHTLYEQSASISREIGETPRSRPW